MSTIFSIGGVTIFTSSKASHIVNNSQSITRYTTGQKINQNDFEEFQSFPNVLVSSNFFVQAEGKDLVVVAKSPNDSKKMLKFVVMGQNGVFAMGEQQVDSSSDSENSGEDFFGDLSSWKSVQYTFPNFLAFSPAQNMQLMYWDSKKKYIILNPLSGTTYTTNFIEFSAFEEKGIPGTSSIIGTKTCFVKDHFFYSLVGERFINIGNNIKTSIVSQLSLGNSGMSTYCFKYLGGFYIVGSSGGNLGFSQDLCEWDFKE